MKYLASIEELIVEFHCGTFILFIENYPGVSRRFGHRCTLYTMCQSLSSLLILFMCQLGCYEQLNSVHNGVN